MENKEKLTEHLLNNKTELEDFIDDYFLLKKRVEDFDKDLKSTITKKNRHLRNKDKKIKHLEWDNLVHRQGHGRLYTSLHSLRKELEEKGIKTDWVN